MEAFVYVWTDRLTNKLYIGYHKGNPDDGYVCSSKLMLEEYSKRPEDFSREILARGSFEDIRLFEASLLKSAKVRKDPMYYNQHEGNGNFYLKGHTQEAKDKIAAGHIGRKRPDLTKRNALGLSETTKKKISENHADVSGTNNPMFGKKHSKETLIKISENRKGKGRKPASEETKKRMSEARKLYWKKKKGEL